MSDELKAIEAMNPQLLLAVENMDILKKLEEELIMRIRGGRTNAIHSDEIM